MLRRYEAIFLILIILSLILAVRFIFHFSTQKNFKVGERVVLEHTFLKIPMRNDFQQYFYVDDLLITMPLYPEYSYGDHLRLRGIITSYTSSDRDDVTEMLVLKNPEAKFVESRILAVFKSIRQKIISAYKLALPPREAGLMAGIVIGADDGLNSEFKNELKRSGMLHVVVASGSNVVFISGIVFGFIGNTVKRKFSISITITLIFLYALLTGFDPPIVRASIMASFGFAALAFGRQKIALFSLFFSAWLMLMISPKLISDIGFQLSFSATLGIMLFQKAVFALSRLIPTLLKEDFTTTLAAQIGALPFLLVSFGEVNMLSIFINVLLLWTVPIIMIFGLIGGIIGLISPVLSMPLILLTYPFLLLFNTVVTISSNLYIPLSLDSIFLPVIVLYYVLLVLILMKRRSRV